MAPPPRRPYRPESSRRTPWAIGFSWPGVGNTWIVQTIQEIKYAGSKDQSVKEFRFVEANWQPAKQVADIEDLMAHKVDALIIVPISVRSGQSAGRRGSQGRHPGDCLRPRRAFQRHRVRLRRRRGFGKTGRRIPEGQAAWQGHVWAFRGVRRGGRGVLRYNGFKKR